MIFKYVIEIAIIFQPLFKLFKNIGAFKSYKKSKLGDFRGSDGLKIQNNRAKMTEKQVMRAFSGGCNVIQSSKTL